MAITAVALVYSLFSLCACPTFAQSYRHFSSPAAHVINGSIVGRHLPSFDQDLFLGIPFARVPRLDNPLPLNDSWTSPLEATTYGPTCYGFGSNQLLALQQSEDCLNLNVIRPSGVSENEKLPVLVWIYGGGFRQGSSADPMWNMSYMVQTSVENGQPIIGVSINYRLSFLGFPAGKEVLTAGATNLGLKDQRIALEWIQENIRAFGGDPKKVTIWGESAGASSVALHFIANGGQDGTRLFRAGLMASGFITGVSNPRPADSTAAEDQYQELLKAANCSAATNGLNCLRMAPLDTIYSVEDNIGSWQPVIDGDFIRREPFREMQDGNVARVPIMLGNNADEGLFVVNTITGLIGSVPDTEEQLKAVLAEVIPGLDNSTISGLLQAYPGDSPKPPYSLPIDYAWCASLEAVDLTCGAEYRRAAAILGDWFVDAGRREMAEHWTKLGLPAYAYRFAANPTALPIQVWTGLGPGFSIHGADLAYDFRLPGGFTTSIEFYPPVKNVRSHEELSRVMVGKFISFTHSLNPNAFHDSEVEEWKPYSRSSTNYVFNASDTSLLVHNEPDDYRSEAIDIWNSHIQAAYYDQE